MGISFAPSIRAVSNSQGSRTSRSVKDSPSSSLLFTSSGVISYSIIGCCRKRFCSLLPRPLRLPLLHKRPNAFVGVCGLHQLVEINSLGASQALIEVHRVPRVRRLLGHRQRRRTELAKVSDAIVHRRRQLTLTHRTIRQSNLRRLFAGDRPPSQNQ